MPIHDFKPVVDELWSAFEELGIEDGYDIVAQATLLLAIRRLDVVHTAAEKKSNATGMPIEDPIFDAGTDELRWSRLKNLEGSTMFSLFETRVVQFLRDRGGTFADVVFFIPTAHALSRVVDLVDKVPYSSPETNGAVYEYLISKITTKNSSGGFPTPRHLVDLMVRIIDPQSSDVIADPASGTGGFLIATADYVRETNPGLFLDATSREHYENRLLHGFDSDPAFARISAMNLLLHGVHRPDIRRRNSLSAIPDDVEKYTVVMTNPPFNGSVEKSALDKALHRDFKSTTKAPLFVGRVLSLLQSGGRVAIIVPEGVLFGTRKAQVALRKTLVDDHKLEAVIRVPPAAYQPFASTQTAILIFTKTGAGGTDKVWFYDIRADGRSLDKKRLRVDQNDLPDVLARWKTLGHPTSPELTRTRTEQSFFVPHQEIAESDYLLTFSRYQSIPEDSTPHRPPGEILGDIKVLSIEIDRVIADLEDLLQ
ncbi:class I SAM-dependent DNA methyltransferase [Rhodococcoides fascians]|uniref:class I SAM-dependent DNA methyltransferase n=1 Tax=Rhodococcoides fascians TaxID=1828 RepID=UPI001DD24160|nr:N-6 DNA methylase [Rhodococcus fascians]CAH0230407.1 Type I restriction enzyme EcoKI M protein [Rhodococcus fascians]